MYINLPFVLKMWEFFMFAILMFVTVTIYAIMCLRYTYVQPRVEEDPEGKEEKGVDNEAFGTIASDTDLATITKSGEKGKLTDDDCNAAGTADNDTWCSSTRL